jgi:beta-glucosidase/6-phospho-beta-glucosidase/beta-galactosidase
MNYPQFPLHFIFWAATAAYKMEGACCADGKAQSI